MSLSRPKKDKAPQIGAVEAALMLISKRSYSKKGLAGKLMLKGYSAQDTAKAVERLMELNYINDEKYAKNLSEYLALQGKGEYYIKAELEKHEITSEIIQTVLQEIKSETEPYEQIISMIRKRYPDFSNSNMALKRKAVAFFSRRGFNLDDILKAFNRF